MIGDAVIGFRGVEKALGETFPLRINEFSLREHERVALSGLPGAMGEAFMNLIVGALLPDEGDVVVFGVNTKDIRTDTEWLTSLDRFGLVSNRAVLLDQSTVAENLALPLTLAIDPMAPEMRATVEALAREVRLPLELLDRPVNALGPAVDPIAVRARMHLARALAHQPRVLLLEHPTATPHATADSFGATLRSIAEARNLSFVAVSDDEVFLRATGARRLRVDRDGTVRSAGFSWRQLMGVAGWR